MKNWLRILMALAATLTIGTAAHAARPSQPMELFLGNPIETTSGKPLSAVEAEQAMTRAGAARGWKITRNADGTLNAHLPIRKHTLDVTIRIDGRQYDIVYRDSAVLGYAPNPDDPERPLIHPSYNKWVKTLVSDFTLEFARQ
ncbi:hypothetical protein [Pseudothauera rhizosphaerae]|uniref:Lipoprotein n=1 Tax=Pseudothauera rhizosphaerae TaxID=2565932 RepID=A0A4S4ART6_9RHOO|nr:hypothetical protein [Pseudothauera rhizosphaerae]THF62492.1 hypothetical protein E6O51_05840 [Pseudothauera rhizosphaerae]